MFRTIAVLGLLSAFFAGSAHAALQGGPNFIAMHLGDDGYGLVVNTNAGTFDAVALAMAVRDDPDARLLRTIKPGHRRAGAR